MINFKNIDFAFDNKTIIHRFSEHIEKGEHVCIMGESGAGKSTLLNSIVGLTVPNEGEITVDGLVVNPTNIQAIRSRVAWVPQEINLPFEYVYQTVEAPFQLKANKTLNFEKDKLFNLFEKVGLSRNIYQQRMREISGGERQRLMLISAFMLNKKIMLLDEPTSALDTITRNKLTAFFQSLTDVTIVAITHDEHFSQTFDRIITLHKL